MIAAHNVSVAAGGQLRARHVSLEVQPGEVVALVGPNGAGKSTLFAALCGDLATQQGTVTLHRRGLNSWSRAERARRMAVLAQSPEAALGLCAHDVVALGLELALGVDDPLLVQRALDRVGLRDRAHVAVSLLSGGERQRVHLARVLAQADASPVPLAILLDEPTSAQDPGRLQHLLATFARLARDGHALLIVLHDLTAAAAVADRVGLMVDGELRALGPPADVLRADTLTHAYSAVLDVTQAPHTGRPLITPRLTLEFP